MSVEFFSTGCTLLDLALGGGWPHGRVSNIVGDKSSGKTLLAIEAFANFAPIPGARMRYAEIESAFDDDYASSLGFPSTVVKPEDQLSTVEEFHDDLEKFVDEKGGPGLYIIDSLDALSDEAEKKRDIREGTFGTNKAKQMSAMFRKINQKISKSNSNLIVISQVRDNIGVMFGEDETRSGGRALDFYASQIVWLTECGKITKEVKGQKRPVGVDVRAKVKKCKTGVPFREVYFQVMFGYGVDDEASMLYFLKDTGEIDKKAHEELLKSLKKIRTERDFPAIYDLNSMLKGRVTTLWKEIEAKIAPEISKYEARGGEGKGK